MRLVLLLLLPVFVSTDLLHGNWLITRGHVDLMSVDMKTCQSIRGAVWSSAFRQCICNHVVQSTFHWDYEKKIFGCYTRVEIEADCKMNANSNQVALMRYEGIKAVLSNPILGGFKSSHAKFYTVLQLFSWNNKQWVHTDRSIKFINNNRIEIENVYPGYQGSIFKIVFKSTKWTTTHCLLVKTPGNTIYVTQKPVPPTVTSTGPTASPTTIKTSAKSTKSQNTVTKTSHQKTKTTIYKKKTIETTAGVVRFTTQLAREENPSNHSDGSIPIGWLVGSCVVLLFIATFTLCCYRRQKNNKNQKIIHKFDKFFKKQPQQSSTKLEGKLKSSQKYTSIERTNTSEESYAELTSVYAETQQFNENVYTDTQSNQPIYTYLTPEQNEAKQQPIYSESNESPIYMETEPDEYTQTQTASQQDCNLSENIYTQTTSNQEKSENENISTVPIYMETEPEIEKEIPDYESLT